MREHSTGDRETSIYTAVSTSSWSIVHSCLLRYQVSMHCRGTADLLSQRHTPIFFALCRTVFLQHFQWSGTLCSNSDCSRNGTRVFFGGTPEAQWAEIRGQRRRSGEWFFGRLPTS